MRTLARADARRITLAAQGFDRPRPRRPADSGLLRRTIGRLGLLQIDSVNVLVRAHYQPLFSRLGPYDRARLDRLVWGGGEFMEHWGHVASILPTEVFPLLRHRMETPRSGHRARAAARHRAYYRRVLEHVREHGPATAADVPEPRGTRRSTSSWWGWSPSKAALEWHLARGQLAVVERGADFVRRFDLTERVLPSEHLAMRVSEDEARRELLRRAARAHGVGTAACLADYYRIPMPKARPRIRDLVEEGTLRPVRVEGIDEPFFLHAEARRPRSVRARALLSPFDPLVWRRDRAERLFDFHYRIEIYVPAAKRRHGYYVLPFLLDEALVARVDLKADREASLLRVQACHTEPDVDRERVARELGAELRDMAAWLGLDDVAVARRGALAPALRQALRHEGPREAAAQRSQSTGKRGSGS